MPASDHLLVVIQQKKSLEKALSRNWRFFIKYLYFLQRPLKTGKIREAARPALLLQVAIDPAVINDLLHPYIA